MKKKKIIQYINEKVKNEKKKIHSSCHPHKSPPSAPLFHVHIRVAFPKDFFAKPSIYVGH